MSAPAEVPLAARWAVALRLGRRDASAHRLRSALVVVLVAVATAVVALPAVMLARAVTPGAGLGISGTRFGFLARFQVDPATLTTLGVVGALAAVQAILLITPAFLLGVRRRVRELGMLSAAGARPSDLRRAILAPGLICGVLGATIGAVVAYVIVLLAIPVATPGEPLTGALGALAAALFGTAVAVAAAWYPAIVAMRDSDLGALRGGRLEGPSHRSAPWILPVALLAVAAGAFLAVQGATSRPVQVIVGVVVAEVGLIAVVGVLLGLVERLPARRAVTMFVLRDAARHRLRVLPAVAASLAMVALATSAMVYQQSQHAQEVSRYVAAAPIGSALVLTDLDESDDRDALADRLALAGIEDATTVRAAVGPEGPPVVVVGGQISGGSLLPSLGPLVGDAALAEALGLPAQAGADLAAGRVLVADAGAIDDGAVRLSVLGSSTEAVVQAAPAESIGRYAAVVLSQDAADTLGLTVHDVGVIASGKGPLDDWQVAVLGNGGGDVVVMDNGPPAFQDTATLYGLVAGGIVAVLLVTWVVTALAAQEARADLETLEAVGAPPGTRRRVAAGQAGLVATAGAWCGVPAGIALAALLLEVRAGWGRSAPDVVIPGVPMTVLLVVLPIVVALVSALTASTRAELSRHPDR
ncbi:FtsX-like permease family protein [Cellulomonas sp. Leaf334]|uniref:FtsX-like permease family protein n=1 Tax=Cellulomonas sp. Leaf334 TaxID=1736339 RepID=UPI0006FAC47D|nr:ABC transporter permease [Cellulomonas sp. Leaf334]KQR08518.1 hypothetical protein ASF78_19890 [Cellulomonas sp. Leaf334]